MCSISEQIYKDWKQMLKQMINNICFKWALADEANQPAPNNLSNMDGGSMMNAVCFLSCYVATNKKTTEWAMRGSLRIPSGCCQQHLEKPVIQSEVPSADILTFARFSFPAVRCHNFFCGDKNPHIYIHSWIYSCFLSLYFPSRVQNNISN